jgi:hypothetical protein
MSKRLFSQISVLYTRDTEQRQKLIDDAFVLDEVNDDTGTAGEVVTRLFTLAAGASDEQVTLDKLTRVSTLLIIAEQEITVKLDGVGSPAVPVRPIPANTSGNIVSEYVRQSQPGVVFWRGRISSLYLSNPSGTTTATVTVVMVGDAAV